MTLRVRPWTVKRALPFVRSVHRKLKKVQGAMWAVRVVDGDETVGCALVGHAARMLSQGDETTLCVLRVAVIEGNRNGCSMLLGACARAARAMGADNLVTYTQGDESGVSLRAAGWVDGGMTKGGEHSRDGRQRELAIDPNPKRRWWAPWSKRA
jgi:hypothetical protein